MTNRNRELPWHLGFSWRRVQEELKQDNKFKLGDRYQQDAAIAYVIFTHLFRRIWDLGPLSTKTQRFTIVIKETHDNQEYTREQWIILSQSGLLYLRKKELSRGESDWIGRDKLLVDVLLRRDQWIGSVMPSRRDALNEIIDVVVRHRGSFAKNAAATDNATMFRIIDELEWAVAGFLVAAEF